MGSGLLGSAMVTYETVAKVSFEAFRRMGDGTTASRLAKILERTWDKTEEADNEKVLSKRNSRLSDEIDGAMDAFIKPVIGYETVALDRARLNRPIDNTSKN
jgi:hypothetical protein